MKLDILIETGKIFSLPTYLLRSLIKNEVFRDYLFEIINKEPDILFGTDKIISTLLVNKILSLPVQIL